MKPLGSNMDNCFQVEVTTHLLLAEVKLALLTQRKEVITHHQRLPTGKFIGGQSQTSLMTKFTGCFLVPDNYSDIESNCDVRFQMSEIISISVSF
jgi:hypothetical protein